jgi:hypothetical protein
VPDFYGLIQNSPPVEKQLGQYQKRNLLRGGHYLCVQAITLVNTTNPHFTCHSHVHTGALQFIAQAMGISCLL